jgi:RHS repeat-associated protein
LSRRLASILQFLLAMAAAMAAGSAACAEAPTVIAPLQVEPDHNNVNLHNGKTRIEMPVLSVPAAPNLRFDRLQNAAPYFTARIYTALSDDHDSRSYAIHIGAESSDAIDCYDDECTSVSASGAVFDWRHRTYLQAGSGVLWDFTSRAVETPSPNRALAYYATVATYPNGETIGFEYDTAAPGLPFNRVLHRPRKLTSSLGYYIAISYADDSDPLSNDWSRVTQAALYRDGATPTLLRRFTYSGATIRDHGASTADNGRDYVCTGCVNALGADIEVSAGSMQLPGEGTQNPPLPPVLQVTPLNSGNNPVVGAVTRDGVVWSYSYVNLRLQPGTSRWLFDKMTVNGPNDSQQVYDVANSYRSVYEQATNRIHTTITRVTTRVSLNPTVSRFTSYYYDFYDRPTRIVYPELNEVSVVYDFHGNITSRTITPKPGSGPAITEYANFPVAGCGPDDSPTVLCWRPTWTRDAMQHQTDYAYNASGQLTEQIDPADANGVRRRTSTTYGGAPSRRTAVRVCADTGATCGANALAQTEYEYWGSTYLPSVERRRDVSTGAALEMLYAYDLAGRLISTDGPLAGTGDATYNRYDVYGRRTWEIGALGPGGLRPATRYTYRDSDDKPLSTETGTIPDAASADLAVVSRTDLSYDGRRNPIREAASAPGTAATLIQRSFDDSGRVECEARRMNPAAFGALPDACTPGPQGSGGGDYGPDRITRTVYDAAGQLLQMREGVGTPDEGAEATWDYNLNGQLTTLIDGNGNRAELRYDGHGRQSCWLFPSPTRPPAFDDSTPALALATAGSVNGDCVSQGDFESYTYDAAGNRTSLRKRDGTTIGYSYDNLNRLTGRDLPANAWYNLDRSFSYDVLGRMISAGGNGTIALTWDGFGRLTAEVGPFGTVGYQYDDAGRRTRLTWPGGFYVTYDYFDNGALAHIRENGAATGAGVLATLSYDGLGRRTRLDRGNGAATTYAYDELSRLTGLHHLFAGGTGNVAWSFDHNPASGLRSAARDNNDYAWAGHYAVNRAYTTNGRNQYIAAGAASFGYDPNGNLTSDGSRGFEYNAENRLTVGYIGAAHQELIDDARDRLFRYYDGTANRWLLYDGTNLIAEVDGNGTTLRRYVHGPGEDEPLVWYEVASSGERHWLHADAQGSVVALSDANGALSSINRYDEYGIPAATNVGRFQYTGQAFLPELGMYYYKARFYSPSLGRFLQTDPIGYSGGFNLYGYVGDDPVNYADPSGAARACTSVTGALIGACVTVDADFNNDGRDDLSGSQLGRVGSDFHGFIQNHQGQDISNAGKPILGDATLPDKAITSVVSQFVGASVTGAAARQWANVVNINASARHYTGEAARYVPYRDSTGRDLGKGTIYVGGRVGWFFGGYAYDSPSNMARTLLHEMGHTPTAPLTWGEHNRIDGRARGWLRAYGLDGSRCWNTQTLFGTEGFPGC